MKIKGVSMTTYALSSPDLIDVCEHYLRVKQYPNVQPLRNVTDLVLHTLNSSNDNVVIFTTALDSELFMYLMENRRSLGSIKVFTNNRGVGMVYNNAQFDVYRVSDNDNIPLDNDFNSYQNILKLDRTGSRSFPELFKFDVNRPVTAVCYDTVLKKVLNEVKIDYIRFSPDNDVSVDRSPDRIYRIVNVRDGVMFGKNTASELARQREHEQEFKQASQEAQGFGALRGYNAQKTTGVQAAVEAVLGISIASRDSSGEVVQIYAGDPDMQATQRVAQVNPAAMSTGQIQGSVDDSEQHYDADAKFGDIQDLPESQDQLDSDVDVIESIKESSKVKESASAESVEIKADASAESVEIKADVSVSSEVIPSDTAVAKAENSQDVAGVENSQDVAGVHDSQDAIVSDAVDASNHFEAVNTVATQISEASDKAIAISNEDSNEVTATSNEDSNEATTDSKNSEPIVVQESTSSEESTSSGESTNLFGKSEHVINEVSKPCVDLTKGESKSKSPSDAEIRTEVKPEASSDAEIKVSSEAGAQSEASTNQPTVDIAKPTVDITKPTVDIAKPTVDIAKPTVDTTKPTIKFDDNPKVAIISSNGDLNKPVVDINKPKAQPQAKPTAQSQAKPTAQSQAKPTAQSQVKPTAQSQVKPTAQSQVKLAQQPQRIITPNPQIFTVPQFVMPQYQKTARKNIARMTDTIVASREAHKVQMLGSLKDMPLLQAPITKEFAAQILDKYGPVSLLSYQAREEIRAGLWDLGSVYARQKQSEVSDDSVKGKASSNIADPGSRVSDASITDPGKRRRADGSLITNPGELGDDVNLLSAPEVKGKVTGELIRRAEMKTDGDDELLTPAELDAKLREQALKAASKTADASTGEIVKPDMDLSDENNITKPEDQPEVEKDLISEPQKKGLFGSLLKPNESKSEVKKPKSKKEAKIDKPSKAKNSQRIEVASGDYMQDAKVSKVFVADEAITMAQKRAANEVEGDMHASRIIASAIQDAKKKQAAQDEKDKHIFTDNSKSIKSFIKKDSGLKGALKQLFNGPEEAPEEYLEDVDVAFDFSSLRTRDILNESDELGFKNLYGTQVTIYKSIEDKLIQEGLLSEEDVKALQEEQRQMKLQKNVKMTLIEVAVLLEYLPADVAIKALSEFTGSEVMSEEDVMACDIVSDVFKQDVCKKYCFFVTTGIDGRSQFVTWMGNNLEYSLGSHYFNAVERYTLRQYIMKRLKTWDKW